MSKNVSMNTTQAKTNRERTTTWKRRSSVKERIKCLEENIEGSKETLKEKEKVDRNTLPWTHKQLRKTCSSPCLFEQIKKSPSGKQELGDLHKTCLSISNHAAAVSCQNVNYRRSTSRDPRYRSLSRGKRGGSSSCDNNETCESSCDDKEGKSCDENDGIILSRNRSCDENDGLILTKDRTCDGNDGITISRDSRCDEKYGIEQRRRKGCDDNNYKREKSCDDIIFSSQSRDSSLKSTLQTRTRIQKGRSCDELDGKIHAWKQSYEDRHSSPQTRQTSCDKLGAKVQNTCNDDTHSKSPSRGRSCDELLDKIPEQRKGYEDRISNVQAKERSCHENHVKSQFKERCCDDRHSKIKASKNKCDDKKLYSQSYEKIFDASHFNGRDDTTDSRDSSCDDQGGIEQLRERSCYEKYGNKEYRGRSSDDRDDFRQLRDRTCDDGDGNMPPRYRGSDVRDQYIQSRERGCDSRESIKQPKDRNNEDKDSNIRLRSSSCDHRDDNIRSSENKYEDRDGKDDRDRCRDAGVDSLRRGDEGWTNSVSTEGWDERGETYTGETCTFDKTPLGTNSRNVDVTCRSGNDDTAAKCQNSFDKSDGWQSNHIDKLGYCDEKRNLSRSWTGDSEDSIKCQPMKGVDVKKVRDENLSEEEVDVIKRHQVKKEDIQECRASDDTVTQCRVRSEGTWTKEVTLSPGFCRGDDEYFDKEEDNEVAWQPDSIGKSELETRDKSRIVGVYSAGNSANDGDKAGFRANDDEMGRWRGKENVVAPAGRYVDIAVRGPELVTTPSCGESTGQSQTDTKQRLIHKLRTNTDQLSTETRYHIDDSKEYENKSTDGREYRKQQVYVKDDQQKQFYCGESDLDWAKSEELVHLQQVDGIERRSSGEIELSDSQESIERRRRCDRRRGSNPERELDIEDTETAEFQTSLRKVSSSRATLHKTASATIENTLSDRSHADLGPRATEEGGDVSDNEVGDDDSESGDRRQRTRESSVPERDIDTEDAQTAELQLRLRKQIHLDKKQPEVDSPPQLTLQSDLLLESQSPNLTEESDHIYTSETFAFCRSFQDPNEENSQPLALVHPDLCSSLENLPPFSPLTRISVKMPQNIRRSRSFPGRSFRGFSKTKGPRSGSQGTRSSPTEREGITYDMVSDKGLPPPPHSEDNARRTSEGRMGASRPGNPETVPRPGRKWHLPRSRSSSEQAVLPRNRSNNEHRKDKSPESDPEVEYECTVVCRQGGVLYGNSAKKEEEEGVEEEEETMEDNNDKLPELDPQQRMQLMQVIASMESVRKAGGGGGDSPPPSDLEMQQFIDYMEMGVVNEDRLDYEERRKREFEEEEESEPEPPKRNKQANQYFWRRHYLSIIQEEEEHSEMNSRANSRPSSRIFLNSRPNSSYENTWAQKTEMQGVRNANEIMDQLNPFSSPDTSLTLTPHKMKDIRTSWGSEMSIDSIASINSILSEEGSLASNASIPVDMVSIEGSKEAAEECERRASQSLSHLLDSVQPPSNTPDSMLGYSTTESTRGCESPQATTNRTHLNIKNQNTPSNQKPSIIETSNPFIEAKNPFLQASNPFLEGSNPFLDPQSDTASEDLPPNNDRDKITLKDPSMDQKAIRIVPTTKTLPNPEFYKSISLSPPMEYKTSRNALSHSLSEGNMGQKFKTQVQDIESEKMHREKTGINKWFEDYKELVRGKSIFHRRLGIISPTPVESKLKDSIDSCTKYPQMLLKNVNSRQNTSFDNCTNSLKTGKDHCINPLNASNDNHLSPSRNCSHGTNPINSVESSHLNPSQATSNLTQSGLQGFEINKKPTRRHQIPSARRRKPRSDML